MAKILIALDIDGVLNSSVDHEIIESFIKNNPDWVESLDSLQEQFKDTLVFRKHMGDYVNKASLERLQKLQSIYHFDILGISSWFGGCVSDEVTFKMLGLKNGIVSKNTGGGIGRVNAINDYVSEHPEYQAVIVLDDQECHYNQLNSGIYHICPQNGLSVNNWRKLEKILLCNN